MNRSQERLKFWRETLARYASEDVEPLEFCRMNHLTSKSFYKWRIRLSAELPPEKRGGISALPLLPVAVPPASPARERPCPGPADSGVSIEAGPVKISLSKGFDGETLRRVIEIAGGLTC